MLGARAGQVNESNSPLTYTGVLISNLLSIIPALPQCGQIWVCLSLAIRGSSCCVDGLLLFTLQYFRNFRTNESANVEVKHTAFVECLVHFFAVNPWLHEFIGTGSQPSSIGFAVFCRGMKCAECLYQIRT